MQKGRILGMLALISLSLVACSPATQEPVVGNTPVDVQPTAAPPVSTAVPEATVGVSPLLSTDLVRDCERRDPSAREPRVGEMAIEFALLDVDGNPYILSELLQEKPVVLVFGSFT